MSRRAMLILIAAIAAVHLVLLGLFIATDSAERELLNTGKELEAERSLHSGLESAAGDAEDADAAAVIPPQTASAAQDAARSSTVKPLDLSNLPEAKPAPSVPSTTYTRKPGKTVLSKLLYEKTARDNISALPGASLATTGILVDMDTKRVLWTKNPTKSVPIASLTKIMTILLSYEIAMDDNSPYTLESMIPVTTEAINTAPSKVDFKKGEAFSIRNLLIAASVRSANDAAHLLAQHLGGGKADTFIADMNRRAKELGMVNTTYHNAHGLPGKTKTLDNHSSPEDVVRLCLEFQKHPILMEWAGLRTAPFRPKSDPNYMMLQNHNNLLPGAKTASAGVNGIKTGFTSRAGFCVAASCERSGHHLLAVVTGFPSALDRDKFVRVLLDWGYTQIGIPPVKKSTSSSTRKKSR